MKKWCFLTILMASAFGCGESDPDDVAEVKTMMPIEQVPAAVLKAAREAAPDLTFFAAYKGTYKGHDAIELKGKTKSGQVKELEMSPEGKLLARE
jgi:hypothetical protein